MRLFKLTQHAIELFQQALGKTGADLAGVIELAVLVIADEQRAESCPGSRRLSKPSDYKFLALFALHFEPAATPARLVGGIHPFDDQSFKPLPARFLKRGLVISNDVIAILEHGIDPSTVQE